MGRENRERRWDIGLAIGTSLVIAAVIVAAIATAGFGMLDGEAERKPFGACSEYSFDPSGWADTKNHNRSDSTDPGDLSQAQLHARQLVACDAVDGKSRSAIVRLLGEPTDRERHWFTYDVGLAPDTFFLETESLTIRFDESGRADLVKLHA